MIKYTLNLIRYCTSTTQNPKTKTTTKQNKRKEMHLKWTLVSRERIEIQHKPYT